jgi:hypothetical protein
MICAVIDAAKRTPLGILACGSSSHVRFWPIRALVGLGDLAEVHGHLGNLRNQAGENAALRPAHRDIKMASFTGREGVILKSLFPKGLKEIIRLR